MINKSQKDSHLYKSLFKDEIVNKEMQKQEENLTQQATS